MDGPAIRKQYIILDSNASSMQGTQAALYFTKIAKLSGYADIKLVFPTILLAEINLRNIGYKRQCHREAQNYDGKGRRTESGMYMGEALKENAVFSHGVKNARRAE